MKTPRQLAKERQHIFEAFAEGQEVQSHYIPPCGWVDRIDLDGLTDPNFTWRIKPKKLECWVNVYAGQMFAAHPTKKSASMGATYAASNAIRIAVHMVEADDT